jgi:hypothetical protein
MTTKLMSKNSKSYTKTHRGCASEEPDEGNLQVRFCEGAHSNLGAITSSKGALWALLDIFTDPYAVMRVPLCS